ncbi:MAG: RhuM family protein [Fibrobacter sp.]|nr:RhuM family protein [Fibrobacter sp.]
MCKICTYCRRRQDLQYQILQSRCDNFGGIPREFYPRIYSRDAVTTRDFFANVQNKLHWAIHRHTAAELIMERADAKKTHMGLTTWRKAPDGKIEKSDVSIAKNYLSKDELHQLERFVTMYLDYAEFQAKRQIPMTMEDWALRLNKFLDFNEVEILTDKGRVSAEIAKAFAESEFEKYRIVQDKLFKSDFDKFLSEAKAIEETHADN